LLIKVITKLRVTVATRIAGFVFFPQELFGYTRTPKFFKEIIYVGLKMLVTILFVGWISGMKLSFQKGILQRK
jgi:hypothetical protein